jgi:cysteinyl-tRNA synthetase
VTLHIYDSAARAVREFESLLPGVASIYVCGATVQAPPHLGHARSAVSFDVLRRWLALAGYEVRFIRNVTDIDDKILNRSTAAGATWWAWAAEQERAFRAAYDALGCLPPTLEPRATGHITEMIELTRCLIDRGHAYVTAGDVYFSVRSCPGYGELSGQDPDATQPGEDDPAGAGKQDLRDFALWKRPRPGEPITASWPTPWGRARPGWHLECSAMSTKYLGDTFDIHGGGRDLIFPHHENERAQSRAAGQVFARYWMHNGLLTVSAEKMSKSQGDPVLVSDVLGRWRPVEVRYYLGSAHYRSTVEFSATALDDAAAAYRRIEHFTSQASQVPAGADAADVAPTELPDAFVKAMDDDLRVPAALAVVHAEVRRGNAAMRRGDLPVARQALRAVLNMTDVLGIAPQQWATSEATLTGHVLDGLMDLALAQRAAARTRGDFGAADEIRRQLADIGITVQDTLGGTQWKISPPAYV